MEIISILLILLEFAGYTAYEKNINRNPLNTGLFSHFRHFNGLKSRGEDFMRQAEYKWALLVRFLAGTILILVIVVGFYLAIEEAPYD